MMKKDSVKKKDEFDMDFSNCKKVMTSHLPLLFANSFPKSLETISQPELEEFVPFMVRCSLGPELIQNPKLLNNCRAPDWWPKGFLFKFPLVDQNEYTNRLVMLKSLVCRCYTYHNSEFLLKFSSELAEMSRSNLRFEENEDRTTSIYDAKGALLVRCLNENIDYDKHKNQRRYLSPAHRSSLNQTKRFEPVIDLTFDTSSEDEKEVYFKETAPASRKAGKRKASIERSEEPAAKQRCVRRVFDDFPQEAPEPTVYSQEQYMEKFQLIPIGKEIHKEELKVERRKRLAHSFNILSISSKRGQALLMKNKHSFDVESCLYRLERFCGPGNQEDAESSQVYTRAAAVFSALCKQNENKPVEDDGPEIVVDPIDEKWSHTYKWPHRTNNPVYPYVGPSIKPCTVLLKKLSEEEINHYLENNNKRTVSTMTPEEWWDSEMAICKCQWVPIVGLPKPLYIPGVKKHKKSSTRCTCGRSKSQYIPSPDGKFSLSDIRMEAEELLESPKQESSLKSRSRMSHENSRNGNLSDSGSSINSTSSDSGIEMSSPHKRVLFRRPLAVVASTPPAAVSGPAVSDVPPPRSHIPPTSTIKVNFSRSILDAIKWYSKDDPALILSDGLCEYLTREEVKSNDPSQENIKPLTELTLPSLVKPIDYFQQNLNVSEYDYCFKRTPDGTAKLATRRGERHYLNREPCPSCFQGRDNFCVFEFVRQAKLAGLSLQENQKQLQLWFFKFITAVNKRL